VQLVDRNRRVLETRVADRGGRYGFLTTPESLHAKDVRIAIVPRASGYSFPSRVAPRAEAFVYNNLYYGDVITASENVLISFDIPMDPQKTADYQPLRDAPSLSRGVLVPILADTGFWLGVILVPLSFILDPNPFTFGTLCVFLGTASLRLFGIEQHPFGIVTDASTGKAIPFALMTLNDLTSGRRVAFTVSDERGRYFLVAPKGSYHLTVFTPSIIQPPRQSEHTVRAKRGWITERITL
jgi:hypothetical protein